MNARRERTLELVSTIGTLIALTAAAVLVAALPVLLPPIGLLLSADYLPSACLAVVGTFGFLLTPFLFGPSRHRTAR